MHRCSLWLKYGLLAKENLLILVNTIGATLFLCYVVVFWRFAINKRSTCQQLFSVVMVLGITILYTEMYEINRAEAIEVMGELTLCPSVELKLIEFFLHSIQAICAVWLLWYFLRRPVACWCKLCAQKQPKCFHSHWFWCHFWFRFSGSYLASSSKIISYKFQIWWVLYCRAHSFFSSWSTPINSDRKHTRQKEIFRMRYFNRQIDDKFDISVSSTLSTRGICFLHRADEFWYWFILRQSIDLIIIIWWKLKEK